MVISQFLLSVATEGFTRACDTHNVNRAMLKEMCGEIIKFDNNTVTPFSTKQQIVYHYIAIKLQQQNL